MNTSVWNSGRVQWIAQRVSALFVLMFYISLILILPPFSELPTAKLLLAFIQQPWTKILTLLAMLSLLPHVFIGLWIVLTDYIKHCAWRQALLWFWSAVSAISSGIIFYVLLVI